MKPSVVRYKCADPKSPHWVTTPVGYNLPCCPAYRKGRPCGAELKRVTDTQWIANKKGSP